jgi:lipopolysaccharide/colanic/teichoic acid biosynthesis glycosyltransferase
VYKYFFKRVIDFLAAFAGLVLLSPLFLPAILLLLIVNNGRPFFTQRRPGKKGKIFKVIKFKTMNDRKDANGNLLPDFERLTGVGQIIRQTSLDEIPQLLNVLKGDMSLVGPRPLLIEYLPLYDETQSRRHDVRPGITGWAQVNGRNAISWPEKFRLDVWYVDHLSFALDIRILWKTVVKVFRSEGINAGDSVTMEKFTRNST